MHEFYYFFRRNKMKKTTRAIVAVSAIFLILSMATLAADENSIPDDDTTTQVVTYSLSINTGGVAKIRVYGSDGDTGYTESPTVVFSDTHDTAYSVTTAGAEATGPTAYSYVTDMGERSGGSLQYTVAGLPGAYITASAAKSDGDEGTYVNDTLYVKVVDIVDSAGDSTAGTSSDKMGEVQSGNLDTTKHTLGSATRTLISSIPGTNTATGTAPGSYIPGAQILYGFTGAPGVESITVTYTIIGSST